VIIKRMMLLFILAEGAIVAQLKIVYPPMHRPLADRGEVTPEAQPVAGVAGVVGSGIHLE
jgi:hypothetical protein